MEAAINRRIMSSEDLKEYWKHALAYNFYRGLIEALVSENQTTGFDQSEEKIQATRLNVHRMNRVEKTFILNEHLKEKLNLLRSPLKWLVITEGWCGDCARILPVLYKITEQSNGKIHMKTILRDENPELIRAFLTNGMRSVPQLICIDENFHVLAMWGPRPEFAGKLVFNLKSDPQSAPAFKEELHIWHAKDRSQTVEEEIAQMLMLVCNTQRSKN